MAKYSRGLDRSRRHSCNARVTSHGGWTHHRRSSAKQHHSTSLHCGHDAGRRSCCTHGRPGQHRAGARHGRKNRLATYLHTRVPHRLVSRWRSHWCPDSTLVRRDPTTPSQEWRDSCSGTRRRRPIHWLARTHPHLLRARLGTRRRCDSGTYRKVDRAVSIVQGRSLCGVLLDRNTSECGMRWRSCHRCPTSTWLASDLSRLRPSQNELAARWTMLVRCSRCINR
jgi:hypothetical protein